MNKEIVIASDHAGFHLKETIKQAFAHEYNINDLGTYNTDAVDYPDYAKNVVDSLENGKADIGILICASGIGMSIAANRSSQARAALCHDEMTVELARKHNDANILVLGAKIIAPEAAINCVRRFLTTDFEGGRHQQRVNKLS